VLDRKLALAENRGGRAVPDEVALLEQTQIGLQGSDELVDRA
jgi:hypothetical protein